MRSAVSSDVIPMTAADERLGSQATTRAKSYQASRCLVATIVRFAAKKPVVEDLSSRPRKTGKLVRELNSPHLQAYVIRIGLLIEFLEKS